MKKLLAILPILLFGLTMQAQIQKIIHDTYELEEATEITLDLTGSFEVEFWASNNVLTETEVKLYDAKKHVLEFFINEKKRYEIKGMTNGTGYKLSSTDKKREGIAYKGVDCFEEVALIVYIPDSFEKVSDTVYKKKFITYHINFDNSFILITGSNFVIGFLPNTATSHSLKSDPPTSFTVLIQLPSEYYRI